jgi:hypothetical protein
LIISRVHPSNSNRHPDEQLTVYSLRYTVKCEWSLVFFNRRIRPHAELPFDRLAALSEAEGQNSQRKIKQRFCPVNPVPMDFSAFSSERSERA